MNEYIFEAGADLAPFVSFTKGGDRILQRGRIVIPFCATEHRDMSDELKRTPLYERHRALGARLVPFAGWEMPVQYDGVIPEHLAVRGHVGIFDVSHMGQLEIRGPGAIAFVQRMLSNDIDRIGAGGAQYTLLLDESGCPIDDLIAYRFADDHLLLVVNASRVDADRSWLESHLDGADPVRRRPRVA